MVWGLADGTEKDSQPQTGKDYIESFRQSVRVWTEPGPSTARLSLWPPSNTLQLSSPASLRCHRQGRWSHHHFLFDEKNGARHHCRLSGSGAQSSTWYSSPQKDGHCAQAIFNQHAHWCTCTCAHTCAQAHPEICPQNYATRTHKVEEKV